VTYWKKEITFGQGHNKSEAGEKRRLCAFLEGVWRSEVTVPLINFSTKWI